nr:uncharacterized protein LOC112030075 [Quercus suber]
MRSLWGPLDKKKSKSSMNLLAIAAGIKQKESVNKIVKKFLSSDFVVMLFHYDGIVDDWRDLDWSDHAIHVSAINQTKWWFAKRFLHPDIVSEYAYIFLWDEDLGIENFNVGRYLKIIKEEGFEISQPALDPNISEVHHHLTARDSRSKVHRKINKLIGGGRKCDANSTEPPCTGWVEMMAPVFSRASWHCAWHMIQNDLVHAWGLDFQLGYCAQIALTVEPRRQRTFRCRFLCMLFLLSAGFFIGSAFVVTDYKETQINNMASKSNNRAIFAQRFLSRGFIDAMQNTRWKTCEATRK